MQETWVRSLGQKNPLEEAVAVHSSILTWKMPWTEELPKTMTYRDFLGHKTNIFKKLTTLVDTMTIILKAVLFTTQKSYVVVGNTKPWRV